MIKKSIQSLVVLSLVTCFSQAGLAETSKVFTKEDGRALQKLMSEMNCITEAKPASGKKPKIYCEVKAVRKVRKDLSRGRQDNLELDSIPSLELYGHRQ